MTLMICNTLCNPSVSIKFAFHFAYPSSIFSACIGYLPCTLFNIFTVETLHACLVFFLPYLLHVAGFTRSPFWWYRSWKRLLFVALIYMLLHPWKTGIVLRCEFPQDVNSSFSMWIDPKDFMHMVWEPNIISPDQQPNDIEVLHKKCARCVLRFSVSTLEFADIFM